jgi:hypothetical protein
MQGNLEVYKYVYGTLNWSTEEELYINITSPYQESWWHNMERLASFLVRE